MTPDRGLSMKILFVLLIAFFSCFLFKQAAGSLSLAKLNIISFAFYNIMIFTFIGAVCVLFGFRNHYLIEKIKSDYIVNKTFLFIAYAFILFPAVIIFIQRLFLGKNIKYAFDDYLKQKTRYVGNENIAYFFTIVMTLIGLAATLYVFNCIGMIPIFNLKEIGDDVAIVRMQINRAFTGNTYIKNLVMLTFTPLISYFSYIYFRVTHKKKWALLFAVNLLLSILIKTYDFSKAPVLYYFFYYYIIEITLGNKKIFKRLCSLGVAGGLIIYLQYTYLMGYSSTFLTLSSGPLGRIFMTQVSTLFLHIQAFPASISFLEGASLPTIMAKLIGSSESWVRSGREVMKLYNASGVRSGVAGSMNAFFIGEAYANWGTVGVLIAPIVVAIPFSIAFILALKMKKTPLSIMVYITMFITLTETLQGGFVDYIYNIGLIMSLCLLIGLSVIMKKGRVGISRPLRFIRKV